MRLRQYDPPRPSEMTMRPRMALRLKCPLVPLAWMTLARSAGANGVVVFISKGRPTSAEGLVELHAGIGALRSCGDILLLQREQCALCI